MIAEMFRYSTDVCEQLLSAEHLAAVRPLFEPIGFQDPAAAWERLRGLSQSAAERAALVPCLPAVLFALVDAADPDASLLNFSRYVQAVPNRETLFCALAASPRSVEILLRLFVSSQFLTEILVRHPEELEVLSRHQRLAEIKSPLRLLAEAEESIRAASSLGERLDALRRFQQRELLRLAACDTFHLLDLQSVTQQLARLAESLVQCSLGLVAEELGIDAEDFTVLAFGKLGGEELNYSSDIDLVFLARQEPERYWGLAQKLIRALNETTSEGFLYRVDMRLRPWGRSGPLVTTPAAYLDYLRTYGRLWEKQALLKARPIAGSLALGEEFLRAAEPILLNVDPEEARRSILHLKAEMERSAGRGERPDADVKTGPGGIREIEFLTQFLQWTQGRTVPRIRSPGTLSALVQLADAELILPGEYRHLVTAYVFLRTVEHALQLRHNKQRHTLPDHPRELANLAARLDYESVEHFLHHHAEHRRYVRDIFDRRLRPASPSLPQSAADRPDITPHLGEAAAGYAEVFAPDETQRQLALLNRLGPDEPVCLEVRPLPEHRWELTVVGYDQLGDLSLMCGLLHLEGFDIEAGRVFTGGQIVAAEDHVGRAGPHGEGERRRKFVNVFRVRHPRGQPDADVWKRYETDLRQLLHLAAEGRMREAQGMLARRLGAVLRTHRGRSSRLLPVEIAIDNESAPDATIMHIRGEDTPGFLYELTSALAVSGVSILRMRIHSTAQVVTDTLAVTTADGQKITAPHRLHELRAAVVLTKHFTHLLPRSPDPEAALLRFRSLLEQLFRSENWLEQLASLQQPEVLEALALVLGGSDFLWEDFLRLQHRNLLPLLTDLESLREARDLPRLRQALHGELAGVTDPAEQRRILNAFKDRELFRIDMRHILGYQDRFGMFSQELTWLAEAVIEAAVELCTGELLARFGRPQRTQGGLSRLAVCALGKCGGRELGFASDIELLFVYEDDGQTAGPETIANLDWFTRLVEGVQKAIRAKQQGIFEIDLRLRPYGKAGSLAVSRTAFEAYYREEGPAWPYERQALVKLRAIAGDPDFGREVEQLRDRLVYTGRPFDLAAMRGLRERQIRELVRAGTFHAKLSPGGVVDCEYFVQALQITYGREHPELRAPNTRAALKALEAVGLISDRRPLRDAYRFLRRLVDALRMVRGDARDLTVPPLGSDQFEFLARRLGYGHEPQRLQSDIDRYTAVVLDHTRRLEELLRQPPGRHAAEAGAARSTPNTGALD
jgi:glutamate-ammonia-ligase adenylyltransferase